MAISRVTQNMMSERSLSSLRAVSSRMAEAQERLSSGRQLNRPSDSPAGTTSAMRLRASASDQAQYARNAEDGLAWLGQSDSALSSMLEQTRRARELAVQASSGVAMSPQSREAIATELDQLRGSLLTSANSTYLGRPLFGGVTSGPTAYDASGAFTGTPGAVSRAVSDGRGVRVNVDGPDVFGPDGANLFDGLSALAAAVRAGDSAGVASGQNAIDAVMSRMTTSLAEVGSRYSRVERAVQAAGDAKLQMETTLSAIVDIDMPQAVVELQMQEMAYQAALGATARVVQPSLLDFLR